MSYSIPMVRVGNLFLLMSDLTLFFVHLASLNQHLALILIHKIININI